MSCILQDNEKFSFQFFWNTNIIFVSIFLTGDDFAVSLLAFRPSADADHSGQQARDEPGRGTWAPGHSSLFP